MKQVIKIPKSLLGDDLEAIANLKLRAQQMLLELETKYLGADAKLPGGWRQIPDEYKKRRRA